MCSCTQPPFVVYFVKTISIKTTFVVYMSTTLRVHVSISFLCDNACSNDEVVVTGRDTVFFLVHVRRFLVKRFSYSNISRNIILISWHLIIENRKQWVRRYCVNCLHIISGIHRYDGAKARPKELVTNILKIYVMANDTNTNDDLYASPITLGPFRFTIADVGFLCVLKTYANST